MAYRTQLSMVLLLVQSSFQGSAQQQKSPYNINYATAEWDWGAAGGGFVPGPKDPLAPEIAFCKGPNRPSLRNVLYTPLTTPPRGMGIVFPGPWLLDVNHLESALLMGPAAIWTNGQHPNGQKDGNHPGIPGEPNLVGAKILIQAHFDYRSDPNCPTEFDPRRGGKLVFWFQTTLPTSSHLVGYALAKGIPEKKLPERVVNYVFNRNLLPEALKEDAPEVPLELTADLNQWTCLSRNQLDNRETVGSAVKYTCALNAEELKKAMSAVSQDMGLLLLLPDRDEQGTPLKWLNRDAPEKTVGFAESRLILREFKIVK